MAYGQSDEYSFVFRPDTSVYSRRADKIQTTIVGLFASAFVFHWPHFFPDTPLQYPPTFDARCVLYPSEQVRGYAGGTASCPVQGRARRQHSW